MPDINRRYNIRVGARKSQADGNAEAFALQSQTFRDGVIYASILLGPRRAIPPYGKVSGVGAIERRLHFTHSTLAGVSLKIKTKITMSLNPQTPQTQAPKLTTPIVNCIRVNIPKRMDMICPEELNVCTLATLFQINMSSPGKGNVSSG